MPGWASAADHGSHVGSCCEWPWTPAHICDHRKWSLAFPWPRKSLKSGKITLYLNVRVITWSSVLLSNGSFRGKITVYSFVSFPGWFQRRHISYHCICSIFIWHWLWLDQCLDCGIQTKAQLPINSGRQLKQHVEKNCENTMCSLCSIHPSPCLVRSMLLLGIWLV